MKHVGAEEVVEVHQVLSRIEIGENPDCTTDLLHTQIAMINDRYNIKINLEFHVIIRINRD